MKDDENGSEDYITMLHDIPQEELVRIRVLDLLNANIINIDTFSNININFTVRMNHMNNYWDIVPRYRGINATT